ncbi:hypothetical protein MHB40_17295 [Lysinibacillus sp. FSL K6-0057]|uniref:hypothetical protein n=1 Tax=Lysinibacillus sp. FSL K6-0057 TaxID=2921411 RepID=UPI00315AEB88
MGIVCGEDSNVFDKHFEYGWFVVAFNHNSQFKISMLTVKLAGKYKSIVYGMLLFSLHS